MRIMDEDMFPDYEPKRTPDTIFDYGLSPDSKVLEIFDKLEVKRSGLFPIMELKNLKVAIKLFHKYAEEAEKNLGEYREGNVILGAPEKEYIPSEAALIVSELGKLIQNLLFNPPHEDVDAYKKKNGIKDQQLIYHEISFDHMDVMGSGRFFYAHRMDERVRLNL
jgi:hypothetical protein